jgi:hypothetical protein
LDQFLSADPIYGGNTKAYNYSNGPFNFFDLSGQLDSWCVLSTAVMVASFAALSVGTGGMALGIFAAAGSAVLAGRDIHKQDWTVAVLDGFSAIGGAGELVMLAKATEAARSAEEMKTAWKDSRWGDIGKNFRIAPGGNRGRGRFQLPHYHRRITDSGGNTVPGGGIKWHRPWQRGW